MSASHRIAEDRERWRVSTCTCRYRDQPGSRSVHPSPEISCSEFIMSVRMSSSTLRWKENKSPDLGSQSIITATGFARVGADTPSVARSLGPMAIDAHAGAEYRNGRPESRIQVATQLMILFVLSHREPPA